MNCCLGPDLLPLLLLVPTTTFLIEKRVDAIDMFHLSGFNIQNAIEARQWDGIIEFTQSLTIHHSPGKIRIETNPTVEDSNLPLLFDRDRETNTHEEPSKCL